MSEINESIIRKLHRDLIDGKINIDDLKDHKGEFAAYYKSVYWAVDNNSNGVYDIDLSIYLIAKEQVPKDQEKNSMILFLIQEYLYIDDHQRVSYCHLTGTNSVS